MAGHCQQARFEHPIDSLMTDLPFDNCLSPCGNSAPAGGKHLDHLRGFATV